MIFQSYVADTPVTVHYQVRRGEVVVEHIVGDAHGNVLNVTTMQGSTLEELKQAFAKVIEARLPELESA